eukprot:1455440-Alexandrium_andersonii.AAC.1
MGGSKGQHCKRSPARSSNEASSGDDAGVAVVWDCAACGRWNRQSRATCIGRGQKFDAVAQWQGQGWYTTRKEPKSARRPGKSGSKEGKPPVGQLSQLASGSGATSSSRAAH